MKEFVDLYNSAPTVDNWVKEHNPDVDLIYRGSVANQTQKFSAISALLGLDLPRVVSTHYSKSVQLPVVAWLKEIKPYDMTVMAFARDNFYELNCTIISNKLMDMSVHLLYRTVTKEWLEEQRIRALKYTARTAFEIRPLDDDISIRSRKSYRTIAEDPGYDWYSTNWSSDQIISHNNQYYIVFKAFWEGNPGLPINHYRGEPQKDFTVVGSYAHITNVIAMGFRAAESTGIKERDK